MNLSYNHRQIFGALSAIVFMLTIILAAAFTPGFEVGKTFMSDLTVGAGAGFFIPGMILTGILLLAFFFSEWQEERFWRAKPLMVAALFLGALSALSLIISSLLPITDPLHWQAGSAFFFLAGLTAICHFALFAWDEHAKTPVKPVQLVLGATALFVIADFAFALAQYRILPNPWLASIEWVTAALFAMWLLALAWTADEPIHQHTD